MTAILSYPTNPSAIRQRVVDPRDIEPIGEHVQRSVQRAEVYRRRRLLVLAVLLSLCLGLVSFWRSVDSATTQHDRSPDAVMVSVQPGDTLWSIATWLNPSGDPRPLVDALKDINGSSTLQPGTQLVVPSKLLE